MHACLSDRWRWTPICRRGHSKATGIHCFRFARVLRQPALRISQTSLQQLHLACHFKSAECCLSLKVPILRQAAYTTSSFCRLGKEAFVAHLAVPPAAKTVVAVCHDALINVQAAIACCMLNLACHKVKQYRRCIPHHQTFHGISSHKLCMQIPSHRMFQMLSHNFLQIFTAISSFWQCQVPELDRPEDVMSFDICQVKYS